MSIYAEIYDNLCESRKTRISEYGANSGIHRHHIVPKHMGGTEDLNNFTYLTPREHQIAHFLLWKIHKTPNDLRSMRMLGAKLSVEKRRIVGLWCVENKIGVHGYTREQTLKNLAKGWETQKRENKPNSFYYWSTKEGHRERASIGGKRAIEVLREKYGADNFSRQTEEEHRRIASLGAQASGKFSVYNTKTTKIRKFRTPEERSTFLAENVEWRTGMGPRTTWNVYKDGITKSLGSREEQQEFIKNNPDWSSRKNSSV